MIHVIVVFINQLADRDKGVALFDQTVDDIWQRIRRVCGGIMEQNNAAVAGLIAHAADNFRWRGIFPV